MSGKPMFQYDNSSEDEKFPVHGVQVHRMWLFFHENVFVGFHNMRPPKGDKRRGFMLKTIDKEAKKLYLADMDLDGTDFDMVDEETLNKAAVGHLANNVDILVGLITGLDPDADILPKA